MDKNEPFDFFNETIDKCIERNIDFHITFNYHKGYVSIMSDIKEISTEYDPIFEKFVITHVNKEEKNESENDN